MSRIIWKFHISPADTIEFSMPVGARILTLQTQFGEPCIWAEVDDQAPTEIRKFRTYGTGHPMDGDLTYVGSYQLNGGGLVFHVYEEVG